MSTNLDMRQTREICKGVKLVGGIPMSGQRKKNDIKSTYQKFD